MIELSIAINAIFGGFYQIPKQAMDNISKSFLKCYGNESKTTRRSKDNNIRSIVDDIDIFV